jgi:hypothetical protein
MSDAPPSGPPPKKPKVKRVVATFDYTASEAKELSFKKGDIITLLRADESGWSKGELDGKQGWFPSDFVERKKKPKKKTSKVNILEETSSEPVKQAKVSTVRSRLCCIFSIIIIRATVGVLDMQSRKQF